MSHIFTTEVMGLDCAIDVELDEEGSVEQIDVELLIGNERVPVDRKQMSVEFFNQALAAAKKEIEQQGADEAYNAAGDKYEERRWA